ncbi:uncharacterized protein [Rutidosis leptorrhynchoides]|uniref:uncharacterized protein n=1 Tax=Rutidosis leptorrhynchoides TaxID=125765 RepID=UPI003A99C7E7
MEEGRFLGFKITPRGIKANSKKIQAIENMQSPKSKKDVQSLNGNLAALIRFLSRATDRALPFFQTLKGCLSKKDLIWTDEAERAFQDMKAFLKELPALTAPISGETLTVYLAASTEAISSVLIADRGKTQILVYFISKVLQNGEVNYPAMEKLIYALVHIAKRLRRYFQAHPIQVLTDQPIKHVLTRPKISGRMAKWAIELGEHEITFLPRHSVKGQVIADFLVELPSDMIKQGETTVTRREVDEFWELYTDGASSEEGAGIGIILVSPTGEEITYVIRLKFAASNNEAEYEALIAGLRLAKSIDVRLPREIVSDNVTQFAHNLFKDWCADMDIQQSFTFGAYPQANGQVEVTNRDIVAGIKAILGKHRQGWVDELQHVLWAHRTTLKDSTNETPFSLVYGTEAVIPAEVLVPTDRITKFNEQQNDDALRENLDALEERRTIAHIRQAEKKQQIANHYDKKFKPLDFQLNDLVLRSNEASRQQDVGKLGPRWEGPYRVVGITEYGAYHLETPDGIPIQHPWYAFHLKKYHV